MTEVIAALREVTKIYPGTIAARGVSIEFFSGELHALVGENGAGKSTLVKMLAGTLQPDLGFVEIRGKRRRFTKPRAALTAGIGVVHQSGSLIDSLTVKENLALGNFLTRRLVRGKLNRSAELSPEISPNTYVRDLSPRQRQMVEIHRLLLQQAQVLVLDESTSNLAPHESGFVFAELKRLALSGYAVIVVSHKLRELVEHCDRFTVLKNGQVIGQLTSDEASVETMVRLFNRANASTTIPPAVEATEAGKSVAARANSLIRFNEVRTLFQSDTEWVYDANFEVRRGEILGLAGRPGSGISTILRLLRRQPVPLTSGSVEWGKDSEVGPDGRIGFVPGDRVGQGLIGALTVGENLMLRRRHLLGRIGSYRSRRQRLAFVNSLMTKFNVRPANPNRPLATLSGGNAQKVLLAREMEFSDSLLIVESPTAGLDIGSASFVRRMLREKANTGTAVVLASDDPDELAELCDRVIVFYDGENVSELQDSEITSESLGISMSGSAPGLAFTANAASKAVSLR